MSNSEGCEQHEAETMSKPNKVIRLTSWPAPGVFVDYSRPGRLPVQARTHPRTQASKEQSRTLTQHARALAPSALESSSPQSLSANAITDFLLIAGEACTSALLGDIFSDPYGSFVWPSSQPVEQEARVAISHKERNESLT